jgi:hypothetical protein
MNEYTESQVNSLGKTDETLAQFIPASCNYLRSVKQTLAQLSEVTPETPIIVDFDETLFLRNSTEEYLNSLKPQTLAVVLLLLLEKLKPWCWLPSLRQRPEARDWFRVVIVTLLFPWTLLLWPKYARELGQTQSNLHLVEAFKQKPQMQIIVATQGFQPIVQPILSGMSVKVERLVACRLWWGLRDRLKGKLSLLQQHLHPDTIKQSLAITDSMDDITLLETVAYPCLLKWPEALYEPALADAYLPFLYLEKGKHPGEGFFAKVVIYQEWLSLCLATSLLNPQPLQHALSMLFLVLSFWCIYEIGYIENDRIAEKYEAKPKLSATYQRYIKRFDPWLPWFWATFFAVPGLILLTSVETIEYSEHLSFFQINFSQPIIIAGLWLVFLLAVRLTFCIYNLMDVDSRVWLYPILQSYKGFGFLLVTSTNLIGSMFFTSYIVTRWFPYFIYRRGGNRKQFPEQLLQCFMFLLLLSSILLGTRQISLILNWQAGIILGWLMFRARHQFMELLKQVQFIKLDI